MKKYLLLLFTVVLIFSARAQQFTGQWKGEFFDKSTASAGWGGDRCDYVLELEVNGNNVTGYSYTYFKDAGKNYYTICKLTGFIDKPKKYIEVTEIERTKTNIPNTIRNCFQVHKLTYFKQGDTETIEGKWDPAPNQLGGCGFGSTVLTRRTLAKNFPGYNNSPSKTIAKKPILKEKIQPETTRVKPVVPAAPVVKKPVIKKPPVPAKKEMVLVPKKGSVKQDTQPELTLPEAIKPAPEKSCTLPAGFEKRNNTVLKTIKVENKKVRVDLYDNGEVDGDSISLFYNGKLLLSHKRLSEKPITLDISVDDDKEMNELVMYAENLGTIAPNTALMIVTDGPKRYEVRITSDLQKSGVINFVRKPAVTAGN
ncbi:MAG TPA: hypothetical protein PLC48_12775 [Ferruginibacter sp.]|nr:hypothetical protein [Ferruginibacter sp.]